MISELRPGQASVDPRVVPALDALIGADDADPVDRVRAVIAAADAADTRQGIRRIIIDDDAVSRVATALGEAHNRGDEFDVNDYVRTARQVIAALAREV